MTSGRPIEKQVWGRDPQETPAPTCFAAGFPGFCSESGWKARRFCPSAVCRCDAHFCGVRNKQKMFRGRSPSVRRDTSGDMAAVLSVAPAAG